MKLIDKTILLKKITTIKEAKEFIDELNNKNKIFHFDDDPFDVGCFTDYEAYYIDLRITELFNDNLNWEEHKDPYGYALFVLNYK
jgi:hypothetical protein